ncbi:DMT family transporter [Cohnella endophytica]|uniref:DMT family transporter n=1 Tax=Cohnella endophytica TaxID=2419778 RepID=A0A494YBP9_9BACL|nr:DMT family transporter [Cohnella endophytica]RKP58086.1 DMT family transporter [Cohnella endophytica]
MKGIIFAFLGGACLTLQGVANAQIGERMGTWQAATLTQFTGFLLALLILIALRDRSWRKVTQVKPMYRIGGAFAAVIIFGNVTSIHLIGITFSISALLIAQLGVTFLIDSVGWFGMAKKKPSVPQYVGIGTMIAGILILGS